MQKLVKGAKLDMVNKQKEFKKPNKNIEGLTTIDMQKVEENKEEIKKQIEEAEKDISELAETQPVLANQLMNDLGLFKILIGEDKQ